MAPIRKKNSRFRQQQQQQQQQQQEQQLRQAAGIVNLIMARNALNNFLPQPNLQHLLPFLAHPLTPMGLPPIPALQLPPQQIVPAQSQGPSMATVAQPPNAATSSTVFAPVAQLSGASTSSTASASAAQPSPATASSTASAPFVQPPVAATSATVFAPVAQLSGASTSSTASASVAQPPVAATSSTQRLHQRSAAVAPPAHPANDDGAGPSDPQRGCFDCKQLTCCRLREKNMKKIINWQACDKAYLKEKAMVEKLEKELKKKNIPLPPRSRPQ